MVTSTNLPCDHCGCDLDLDADEHRICEECSRVVHEETCGRKRRGRWICHRCDEVNVMEFLRVEGDVQHALGK